MSHADTPPAGAQPTPKQAIPRSVWQLDDAGNATHVESQWNCPAKFGNYQRHDLHTYDAFGLDVSCDYLNVGIGDVTLYLTKRAGGDINADFDSGKAALLKRFPAATPISDGQQGTFTSDRKWLHATYARSQVSTLDSIWYSWYGDWEFEIRATYAAAQSASVMLTLAQMTGSAQTTSGHLERCAKSTAPTRDGAPISDGGPEMVLAFLTGAVAAGLPKDVSKFEAADSSKLPIEWCAEDGVRDSAEPVLLWHGLNDDGQTVSSDRASLMTVEDPIFVESFADPTLNQIESELKRSDLPIFAVTHETNDGDVNLLRFFSHRPGGSALAKFVSDITRGGAHVLGSYNLKTKKITIVVPEKKTAQ